MPDKSITQRLDDIEAVKRHVFETAFRVTEDEQYRYVGDGRVISEQEFRSLTDELMQDARGIPCKGNLRDMYHVVLRWQHHNSQEPITVSGVIPYHLPVNQEELLDGVYRGVLGLDDMHDHFATNERTNKLSVDISGKSELTYYATMDQLSALCHTSKKTLERLLKKKEMPEPDRKGGDGIAHQWEWKRIKSWAESHFYVKLPDIPPWAKRDWNS